MDVRPSLVLVGSAAVLHVDGIAQIDLVFQHIRYCIPRPVIRALGIQSRMGHVVLGIGIHGRRRAPVLFSGFWRSGWGRCTGAHGENPADDGRRFLIHLQLLCVWVPDITVGCSGPQPFSTLRFGLQHRTDLPAGVPNKPLVKQILERHEVIALAAVGVHIVIDGDVADRRTWESVPQCTGRYEADFYRGG